MFIAMFDQRRRSPSALAKQSRNLIIRFWNLVKLGVLIIFGLCLLRYFYQPGNSIQHEMKISTQQMHIRKQAKGYILLGSVIEQLGQAANHLTDTFELCLRYNRCVCDIIAPVFYQTFRMDLDGKSIFHELYDVDKLPQELSWMTWPNFVDYLNNADIAVVECSFGVELVGREQQAQIERIMRFHSKHARFSTPPGCNLPSTTSYWPPNATEQTWNLEMLDIELLHSKADVVVFYHLDWRFPIPLQRLQNYKIELSAGARARAESTSSSIYHFPVRRAAFPSVILPSAAKIEGPTAPLLGQN